MTRMHLLLLLDRMEEMLAACPKFAGRTLVPSDDLLELLDKIRFALPDEIQQAEALMEQRDAFLQQATDEAERLRSEAHNYVNETISEHIIVERAKEEAERIVGKAEDAAAQLEGEAHQYAHRLLEQLEETLEKSLRVVRKGKSEILDTHKF